MTYLDYLINGGLWLLAFIGFAAVIGGFATGMTNLEYGGRKVPWFIAAVLGVAAVVFAVATLIYRTEMFS